MEKEIICSLEKEGFKAHFYPGCKETNKAIISVGGASCDEKTSIAMTGASTGAGYTLVCASRIPEITCVIPVVPFDYVLEGTSTSNKRLYCSLYTYHGENVPYTECEMLDMGMLNWLKMAIKTGGYGLRRFMRFGYDLLEPNLNKDSRIKVENMNADVLLLAAKNDDCWPSDVATSRMLEVFKEKNYRHRVESYIYDRGSHALVDGMDEISGITKFLFKFMIPAEKKYPKECEEARQDSFKRIIKFIEEW